MSHVPVPIPAALAEKLKEVSPFPVGKVFFANSGSEANDTQIKLFWYANNAQGKPDKKKIISRIKAYHGVTIASASLTGAVVSPMSAGGRCHVRASAFSPTPAWDPDLGWGFSHVMGNTRWYHRVTSDSNWS